MAKSTKVTSAITARGKALAVIVVYAVFSIFSLTMAIYDISTGYVLFGILFALAAIIFMSLLLLKINTVFGTYLRIKGNSLYMKSWLNDFLPYDVNSGLIAELKPSKTKLTEVPIDEISAIFVGSKDFIKRNISEAGKRFIKALYPYEHSSKKSKNALISPLDIFYIETTDNDCSFMCIDGYSAESVSAVIAEIYENNPDIYIKVGSREYKRYIRQLQEKYE